MRKNLEMVNAQIQHLEADTTDGEESGDDPNSWMQAEVERERTEQVDAHRTVLEEIRSIITTFLEKRTT